MCKIHGTKDCTSLVSHELDVLISSVANNRDVKSPKSGNGIRRTFGQFTRRECVIPLALMTAFVFFQQSTGTFVILFYAIDVVKLAGLRHDPYVTINIIGAIRLAGALASSYLSKGHGRRTLSLFSGVAMTITMTTLGLSVIYLGESYSSVAGLVLLSSYFVANVLGFLPIPFAMLAEVFPNEIRGTAAGFVAGVGYLFGFVAVKIYPDLMAVHDGRWVFFTHAIFALLGTVFVAIFLPETRGKSLAEVELLFAREKKTHHRSDSICLPSNQ